MWQRNWKCQEDTGRLIVCPTAKNPGETLTNWVTIGDGDHPGLDEHQDERFILALGDHIRALYGVENVYIGGFSSGAKMTHHMYVTNADKFHGFGVCAHGIGTAMVGIAPPAARPIRISFGTSDENYELGSAGSLPAMETLLWYLGNGTAAHTTSAASGTQYKSKTFDFKTVPAIQFCKVIGAPHQWFEVQKGAPRNEDAALIAFWEHAAGMVR